MLESLDCFPVWCCKQWELGNQPEASNTCWLSTLFSVLQVCLPQPLAPPSEAGFAICKEGGPHSWDTYRSFPSYSVFTVSLAHSLLLLSFPVMRKPSKKALFRSPSWVLTADLPSVHFHVFEVYALRCQTNSLHIETLGRRGFALSSILVSYM